MNASKVWCVLLASLSLIPTVTRAEQQAQARIYCMSLQFQRGLDTSAEFSIDFENSELWPYSSGSHAANVSFKDNFSGASWPGDILLAIPDIGDANGNGYPDFFESAQGFDNVGSTGSYNLTGWGSGTLQASWSRMAGTSVGSCEFTLKPTPSTSWLSFSFTFQLLEYTGLISYTPGATQVTGRADLVQTDSSGASVFDGPVAFVKTTTNRFNALMLQPGTWTNASQLPMTYTNNLFQRDIRWPTHYYGDVVFDDDANPNTAYPFDWWVLSIDDPNDSNHNGIPDFSDDPGGPGLPRRPQLSLSSGTNNLWLTIAGDVGHVHQVQEATSLAVTNWVTVWSQTLTNDPQIVSLPAPSVPAKFWRVLAQ